MIGIKGFFCHSSDISYKFIGCCRIYIWTGVNEINISFNRVYWRYRWSVKDWQSQPYQKRVNNLWWAYLSHLECIKQRVRLSYEQ